MRDGVTDLEITSLAVGGDGVGRAADGRVVFVAGTVPGDEVSVVVVEERPRFARAELAAVLRPSPDRVTPPCPEVARGCGGCGLQHVGLDAQRRLKRQLVVDALERIGRLTAPDVIDGPELSTDRFRTTARVGVVGGRAGFRRAHSHDVVVVDGCLVAHPLVEELILDGRYGAAQEVTIRVGAGTGERLVAVRGPIADVRVPDGVVVVAADRPGDAHYHERVAGRLWRVSAGSFFQSRADGAAALVQVVAKELQLGGLPPDGASVVDAYGGVGLLSAAAPVDARVAVVEANASAAADARVDLTGRRADVHHVAFERWPAGGADAVIADPARRGLAAGGVKVVAATGAPLLLLVSCDAGSLGRDAGLLVDAGYRLERSTVIDLFPHTPHVEVVSRFRR